MKGNRIETQCWRVRKAPTKVAGNIRSNLVAFILDTQDEFMEIKYQEMPNNNHVEIEGTESKV